jgi:G3E family GTPase
LKTFLVHLLEKASSVKEGSSSSSTEPQIFRMKGILRVADHKKLYILQAVHDVFDLQPSTHDVDSLERLSLGNRSAVIIIGHHLCEETLRSGFTSATNDQSQQKQRVKSELL